MADYVAGSVKYKLEIDSRPFDRDLDKSRDKIKGLGKDADKASKRANSSLGNIAKDSLKEVNKGFNVTRRSVDSFGNSTVKRFTEVNGSAKRVVISQRDIAESGAFMRRQMTGNINAVIGALEAQEKKTRRVKDETTSFRSEIRQAASAVRSLQVAFSGFTGAALIGAVAVAAGVLVELAGAAVAAGGALLTVPAGALVAASAIGTAKTALVGLEDAFKALADGDPEKIAETLERLSPAAKRFVLAAQGFKDAFDPVRRAVQEQLFTGIDKEIARLSKGTMPALERGLGRVATAMNHVLREASETVSAPFFNGLIERSTKGTARAVKTLSSAITPLAEIIDRVVQAGLPYVQQFAEFITQGIKAGAAFLKTESGMAALEARIDTGLKVIGQIVGLVGSLTTSLGLLFKASDSGGQTLIETLTGIVGQFNAWASSAEGQKTLSNAFAFMNKVLQQVFVIVGAVAGVFFSVINYISTLPQPVQDAIASFVGLGIVLTPIIMFVAQFITSLMALGPVFELVGRLLGGAGQFILKFGSVVLRVVTQVGILLGRLALQAILAGGRIALGFLIAMGPIGWIIAAVVGLAIVIALNFERIKKVAIGVWSAVASWTSKTWSGITSAVSSAWSRLVSSVSGGVSKVVNFVRELPGRILRALGNTGRLLWDAGKNMLQGLGNGIQSAVEGVKNKVRDFASGALDTVKKFFGIHSPSRVMAQMGRYMMQGFAQGIIRNASQAVSAATKASEAALAGFGSDTSIYPTLGSGAATALQAKSSGAFNESSTSAQAPAVIQTVNVNVNITGVMAGSQVEKRRVAKDLLEAVNQELRAKRQPEIGVPA